jgi:transaldolase
MSIFVDTASLRAIDDLKNYPFVTGITTNPTLIAKAVGSTSISQEHLTEHLRKIKELFEGQIFIQTNYPDSKSMVEEARQLHQLLGEKLVVKVPVTLPGLQAIDVLTNEGIRTAATAVFTGVQAYIAMGCGAEYVVPYYSRIAHSMQDGLDVIEDILDIIDNSGYDCQVLVASLKNPFDVLQVLRVGAHAVTLPMDLLASLLVNSFTQDAVQEFQHALKIV